MKSGQKIKKLQLSLNELYDITLLGLVCSDPHYKLSLKINKTLKVSLKSAAPVEIGTESGQNLVFTKFSDTGSFPEIILHLFANRCGTEFLIKKLKNIDYLLVINNQGSNTFPALSLTKLREIDSVTAVFTIDLKSLKDKNQEYLIL